MSEGSIQDTVDRLVLWSARRERGLARVEWDSARARQMVLEELRSHFGSQLLEIAFPVGSEPFANVDELFARFSQTDARAVSITGMESVFANHDRRTETLTALSFRRETLASFAIIQIWWIPAVLADQFILGVPDLESWFQLRLRLTETEPEEPLLPVHFDLNKVTTAEAEALAARFWERFPVALSRDVPLKRIWTELAQPALAALFQVGLSDEGRKIQDRFPTLGASFEEELRRIAGKLELDPKVASAELDAENLNDLTAGLNFATMLYIQRDLPSARRLQELVLAVRLRLGEENHETAKSANNLAATLFAQEEYVEAKRLQEMTARIYQRVLGEEHR